MKIIIVACLFVFLSLSSGAPTLTAVETKPVDLQSLEQARIDALSFLYDNILSQFFNGIVNNAANVFQSTLTNLIQTNPLGVGKRDLSAEEVQSRIDALSFLYDNVLSQFFNGIVNNAASLFQSTLTNLIQTNPLGVGKRDLSAEEVQSRIDALSFLYDNVLSQFFSGIVSNAASLFQSTLTNLIQTNPLGVGKRDLSAEVQSRIDALSFLYDNVLSQFFSGIVSNAASLFQSTLTNLIQTNPLGVGKRDLSAEEVQSRIDALSFLYDNVLSQFFSGIVSNAASLFQSTLTNLIQTNPLGVGK